MNKIEQMKTKKRREKEKKTVTFDPMRYDKQGKKEGRKLEDGTRRIDSQKQFDGMKNTPTIE